MVLEVEKSKINVLAYSFLGEDTLPGPLTAAVLLDPILMISPALNYFPKTPSPNTTPGGYSFNV